MALAQAHADIWRHMFPPDSKRPRRLDTEAIHRSGTNPQSKLDYEGVGFAMQAQYSACQPVILAPELEFVAKC